MNEDRAVLQQVEHILGHLWHRYSIRVSQVIVATVKLTKWCVPRNWQWGRLWTTPYDKRDYFNFPIVNFPFICSNIPAAPGYGVYISRLIQYSRACGSYQDFLDRGLLLIRKLLNKGFLLVKLTHHFVSFTVATMTWLTLMEYLCHKWQRVHNGKIKIISFVVRCRS
jgi:hypothetical protein